jgi:hypothetical protein
MAPKSWPRSRKRYKERQEKAVDKVSKYRERLKAQQEALAEVRKEAREKRRAAPRSKKKTIKERYDKRIGVAERRVERTRGMLERARRARDKIKAQYSIAYKKRTWNLGTSLKAYIDPRVYYEWGQEVDYDVLQKYYPKALRRKFAWVKLEERYAIPEYDEDQEADDEDPQAAGASEDVLDAVEQSQYTAGPGIEEARQHVEQD